MRLASTFIGAVAVVLSACGPTMAIGPTPTIPPIPAHWISTGSVSLALEVVDVQHSPDTYDHSLDGFARSANPLEFRSQAVQTAGSTAEQVPQERARARRDEVAMASPEDYERVVGRVRGTYLIRLQRCFDAVQGRAGKLQLEFTVAESGEVRQASVSGLDAGTNACVKKRVMGWSFRGERGGAGDANIVLSVVVM